MLPYHARMQVLLQQAEIDRWLSGETEARELHPASESALREWPIDRRVNRSGVGDDDPTLLEPIESGLLQRREARPKSLLLASNYSRFDLQKRSKPLKLQLFCHYAAFLASKSRPYLVCRHAPCSFRNT